MSQTQQNTENVTPVGVKRAPGRPIVEGSKRQAEMNEKAARRANGTMKKGRPVSETSAANAKRLLAERKAALGVNKPGFNKAKLLKMGIDPVTFEVIGQAPITETVDTAAE
mgnify:CR=1 FL=1